MASLLLQLNYITFFINVVILIAFDKAFFNELKDFQSFCHFLELLKEILVSYLIISLTLAMSHFKRIYWIVFLLLNQ